MTDDKALKLLNEIKDRTDAGEVPWKQSGSGDSFAASYPRHTIRIRIDNDGDYLFSLFNSKGTLVDIIAEGIQEDRATFRTLLKSIHFKAREKFLNVEGEVADLLSELSANDQLF